MSVDKSANGILTIQSHHSVGETVARLERLLDTKGVKLFAKIDHSGEAEKAGLHMPDTKLLIFGSPKAGTALMLAAPSIALDLPLKILIWEDAGSNVWVAYNGAEFLRQRHDLPAALEPALAAVAGLANGIAG